MILQESTVSTALNQDGWPRSRVHPHSSTLKACPPPRPVWGSKATQLEVSMQATLVSPQCKLEPFGSQRCWEPRHRQGRSILSCIWMMLFTERCTEQSRQCLSPEAGTTPCMAYWLRMSGRGQWGRAGGEVLPRPINTATEHWSLQVHDILGSILNTRQGHFFKHTLVVTENVQTTSFDWFPVLDTKLIHVPKVQGLDLQIPGDAGRRGNECGGSRHLGRGRILAMAVPSLSPVMVFFFLSFQFWKKAINK